MAKYKAEGPIKTTDVVADIQRPGLLNVTRAPESEVRERASRSIIDAGGDPSSRSQNFTTTIGDSIAAGTLKQTHPHYITIAHSALPKRGVSESHENYTKKLAAHPAGAIWMRSLSLPGTVMSSQGVHFDPTEFEKHWQKHPQKFVDAFNRGQSLPVPTDAEYNYVHDNVVYQGLKEAKAEWQEMYGDSDNSYQDADGTATGDSVNG